MQTLWLDCDARALIEEEATRWGLRETGGPLFGYEVCGELVVTRACPPGPAAIHLPWLYRPDKRAVQDAIDRFAVASVRWIGSWHTHPFGRPRPSILDRRTAGKIATERGVRCPQPLMMIQTTSLTRMGVRAARLGAFRWDAGAGDLRNVLVK
jgi:integrative and conjugative element protein (TIGR02256 family)